MFADERGKPISNHLALADLQPAARHPGRRQPHRHHFQRFAISGESEIRRCIIENDWLEAVVALPAQQTALIEGLMIQRMSENDKIVTRYMGNGNFQRTAFPILAQEIFEAIHVRS